MGPLKLAKKENFSRNLAQGLNQTQAAIAAGYSENRAASQGSKLAKKPEIIARVNELRARVDQQFITSAVVTKEWWVLGIQNTMEQARAKDKFSEVFKGYELLGKHMRFLDRAAENIDWDGDLSKLNDDQLVALASYFERIAFNGDKEKIEEARKRAQIEAGQIVDTTATLVEEKKPDTEW